MNVSYILESSIPKALEMLKELALTIWKNDYPYIILFLLVVILCAFLNSKIKKIHF